MLHQKSVFQELQVLIELIFWYLFLFSILTLKESLKQCFIFFYFSAVFEKSEILIPKDLLIKRQKGRHRFDQRLFELHR